MPIFADNGKKTPQSVCLPCGEKIFVFALFVHHFEALCKELRCLFHCVDAYALVDCVYTLLVVKRHKEGCKTIDIVAYFTVITAVAIGDKHIRSGDHRREDLLDSDVEVMPRFDVDRKSVV